MNTIEDAARKIRSALKIAAADPDASGVTQASCVEGLTALEVILSMCSKEGPSDEPVAWMAESGDVVAEDTLKRFRGYSDEDARRIVDKYTIPLYRHPAPKVGALPDGIMNEAYIQAVSAAKADASLQGEGSSSSSSLGDPLPPVGSDPSALATLGPEDGDRPKTAALQAPIALPRKPRIGDEVTHRFAPEVFVGGFVVDDNPFRCQSWVTTNGRKPEAVTVRWKGGKRTTHYGPEYKELGPPIAAPHMAFAAQTESHDGIDGWCVFTTRELAEAQVQVWVARDNDASRYHWRKGDGGSWEYGRFSDDGSEFYAIRWANVFEIEIAQTLDAPSHDADKPAKP